MSPLSVHFDGGVAHLRLNRPQALNAMDMALADAFLAACRDIARDGSVRAVWISGEGRAFCAGGDLAAMRDAPADTARRLIDAMHESLRLLGGIDAPVLASVQGAVAGGGFSLAMAADIVIAADDARFSVAYLQLGASGDLGSTWSLPRIVGLRRALGLALLGDRLDTAQALQWGLVSRVVPRESLDAEGWAIARQLASGPTHAMGHLRRLMRDSLDRSFADQLDAERSAFLDCAASADFAEGLDAFFGKRPAHFRGRPGGAA